MTATSYPAALVADTARPTNIYLVEIRMEIMKLLRNRAYSISAIGFPLIFFTMFGTMNRHAGPEGLAIARYMLAGYSCFGAMGASLFGVGNGIAFERSQGWLELKRASPMPPAAYLVAKLVSAIVFAVTTALLLVAAGPLIFGHTFVTMPQVATLLLTVIVGTLPFASLGLLLGLIIPATAGPGFMNLVYLPLSFLGGLWWPVDIMPRVLQLFAHVLPSYWFSRIALAALGSGTGDTRLAYPVLALYMVVFLLLSARTWKRSEARA